MFKIIKNKNIQLDMALSFSSMFMLCFYAPLELYFSNRDEFWFDIYILVPILLFVFIVFFLLSMLFLAGLRKFVRSERRDIIVGAYFVFLVCSYVQGNFLTGYLPPLDGRYIDWNLYSAGRTPSIILWIVVSGMVIMTHRKVEKPIFEKMIQAVSLGISLILMITLFTLCVTNDGMKKKNGYAATTNCEFEMSTEDNFIILVLDSVNASDFDECIKENITAWESFKDFTFFRNTLGAYPCTKNAVPYILSGVWYENDLPFEDYLDGVYSDSLLLNELEKREYTMGLYEEETLLTDTGMEKFVNVSKPLYGVSSWLTFARYQMILTWFRYAPHDLKRLAFLNPEAFEQLRVSRTDTELYSCSNWDFYQACANIPVTYTNKNSFKFIHLRGAHLPVDRDKDMNLIDEGTYRDGVEASITLAEKWLDKIRTAGVYDNSVVIIMADHGYSENISLWDRQNPLLLIKGKNESHEFNISDAPISFSDLQLAYERLLDGSQSDKVFDWKEDDVRERRYLYYADWRHDEEMIEYISYGKANDSSSLIETGKKYVISP